MLKKMGVVLVFVLGVTQQAYAQDATGDHGLVGKSFHFNYEDGAFEADVSFARDSVTWSAEGITQTNPMMVREVDSKTFFLNWQEDDGTLVTVLLDLEEMTVRNSILALSDRGNQVWFLQGVVTTE